MHQGTSTIRAAMSTTPAPLDATPERPPNAAPRASRPTPSDSTIPAERVRVTDVPAHGRDRAYLVERGLEHDGYGALKALVADYVPRPSYSQLCPWRCRFSRAKRPTRWRDDPQSRHRRRCFLRRW
jgi:hypothetical protein